MNVTQGAAFPPTSPKWDGNIIRNPGMVTNKFSPTEKSEAALTLRLVSDDKIVSLKEKLQQYDFTSISTRDLKMIGNMLIESGLVDRSVGLQLGDGRNAFDENGKQTHLDEKFNAIALFYETLEGTLSVSRASPESKMEQQEGYSTTVATLTKTNQVLNALAYFARSSLKDLSIKETA